MLRIFITPLSLIPAIYVTGNIPAEPSIPGTGTRLRAKSERDGMFLGPSDPLPLPGARHGLGDRRGRDHEAHQLGLGPESDLANGSRVAQQQRVVRGIGALGGVVVLETRQRVGLLHARARRGHVADGRSFPFTQVVILKTEF